MITPARKTISKFIGWYVYRDIIDEDMEVAGREPKLCHDVHETQGLTDEHEIYRGI
jgi:hypothetical protein